MSNNEEIGASVSTLSAIRARFSSKTRRSDEHDRPSLVYSDKRLALWPWWTKRASSEYLSGEGTPDDMVRSPKATKSAQLFGRRHNRALYPLVDHS